MPGLINSVIFRGEMSGGGGFNFGKMPKTLTCWICGKGFGTASLKFHIKSCQQKWDIEQEKRPKKSKKTLP
jgi:hypothetical protein